jgi:hypothetical protein
VQYVDSGGETTPNAVQVVLTQPLNTTFANLVTAIWGPNVNTVNVTTTAIAAFPAGMACLLARDSISANAAFVNNGTPPNPNCWVAANSSSGSALNCNGCTITGPTTVVGGDAVSNGGQLNGSPNRTYASAIADPYAATLTHAFLTTPPLSVKCDLSNIIPPCIIPGGQSLTGTVDLSPGTYWITDGVLNLSGILKCTKCVPGGRGVTIIFTQGSAGTIGTLSESGNATINLNAPAPGAGVAYPGLLMVQDPLAGPTSVTIGGNPPSTLSGLIYFPNANLSFVGNIQADTSTNCLVAVANSLSLLTGSVNLAASGCPAVGLTTVPTILSVFLAV